MARCKTPPETVRSKAELAERLRAIRTEQFGERGGPELARRLGLPIRTWYNYEVGVTVPAEILLRFLELTSVEPTWLLHGEGPKYRRNRDTATADSAGSGDVTGLLRLALDLLEDGRPEAVAVPAVLGNGSPGSAAQHVLIRVDDPGDDHGRPANGGPTALMVPREAIGSVRSPRCLLVRGEAMAPLLADGAVVAFADESEPAEQLDGTLVVAAVDDRPVVRRLQLVGHLALLRAINPSVEPIALPLTEPPAETIRRVVWATTLHGSARPRRRDA